MKTVLITGSKGQLANCIKDRINFHSKFKFIFTDIPELDITKEEKVSDFFNNNYIIWCINCAAYTDVDKAESEKVISYQVNEVGAKNLANACKKHNVKLIHISTDFVFNGKSSIPYLEIDKPNPLNIYGRSKLSGEISIKKVLENHFIIRTSWLYSEYDRNFLKTMIRLSKSKNKINVIFDQIGTPTYAGDLAEVILKIISIDSIEFGIYHFSNEGVASWYDFAMAIFTESNHNIEINPIKTKDYFTDANRPFYSVLDKTKIKETFHIKIPYWRDSLKKVIEKI